MSDEPTWGVLYRLARWLAPFRGCFGRRAQHVSLRAYVEGLLSDSPRKAMQPMLARVTEARSYQAFQHFITHSPWSAAAVWQQLRRRLPDRRGVVVIDDTAFLKQGRHSVGVSAQYAGARRGITNCQIAVTAAWWAAGRAWLAGAELYLPETWLTPEARAAAHIPAHVRFQTKWRLALTLLRRLRAAGLHIEAVVADAAYGDISAFRTAVARSGLPYLLGISSDITVFVPAPTLAAAPPRRGRPARRVRLAPATPVWAVAALVQAQPARAWRRVHWRNGAAAPLAADFLALRVTPVAEWRHGHHTLPALWLLAERAVDAATPHRYYFSNLPAPTAVTRLARLAHQRWVVEQQYRDLKTHLGIDHFEGRTYPGWHHHLVLSAVAYAFLQTERRRARPDDVRLTFPQVHALVQEVFTGLLLITHDRYWRWLEQGRRLFPLRI